MNRINTFAWIVCAFMALWLLNTLRANENQNQDWVKHYLNIHKVLACTFTPDSRAIAFNYRDSHLISEMPRKTFYTSHLSIWEYGNGKIEEKYKWDYIEKDKHDPWAFVPRYMEYCADNNILSIFDSEGIRTFEVPSYKLKYFTPFTYPTEETSIRNGIKWNIVGVSFARDGSRLAVALSDPGLNKGGYVRIYDLPSGVIVREWRMKGEVKGIAGIDLSPDAKLVCISWLPQNRSYPETFIPNSIDNVRIMNIKSGEKLLGINTKYIAGPVLFGSKNTLLTSSINYDRRGYSLDTIKIWNSQTGNLLREITNPRTGVHYKLHFSANQQLLLGYTGTEIPIDHFIDIETQQFHVWDFATGNPIAVSPNFGPVEVSSQPSLKLSPDGKSVVVWWGEEFEVKPFVYEIPRD